MFAQYYQHQNVPQQQGLRVFQVRESQANANQHIFMNQMFIPLTLSSKSYSNRKQFQSQELGQGESTQSREIWPGQSPGFAPENRALSAKKRFEDTIGEQTRDFLRKRHYNKHHLSKSKRFKFSKHPMRLSAPIG